MQSCVNWYLVQSHTQVCIWSIQTCLFHPAHLFHTPCPPGCWITILKPRTNLADIATIEKYEPLPSINLEWTFQSFYEMHMECIKSTSTFLLVLPLKLSLIPLILTEWSWLMLSFMPSIIGMVLALIPTLRWLKEVVSMSLGGLLGPSWLAENKERQGKGQNSASIQLGHLATERDRGAANSHHPLKYFLKPRHR